MPYICKLSCKNQWMGKNFSEFCLCRWDLNCLLKLKLLFLRM